MSQGALITWKEECDTIHSEMDRLLASGWLDTAEERQVRKIQFLALIERRNVAAHNCLKYDGARGRSSINQQKPSETPGVLSKADPIFEVNILNVKVSQEPSEAALAIDRTPQASSADPMSEVEIMNIKVSQEPSEATLTIDRNHEAPPVAPMSQAKSFLKFLGRK
jgi:hypothetical protein